MKYPISEAELKSDKKAYFNWRKSIIGSSDASVICNVSPWRTPFQLFCDKTGRTKHEFAPSLNAQLGIQFEGLIRSELELKLDLDFPDQIFVSDTIPYMVSSVDGWNEENKIIAEIKCVLGPQTYLKAVEGKVSEVYWPQLQHQLWVTGGKKTLFYVAKLAGERGQYRVIDKVLVEVLPDKEYQEELIKKCIEFYNCIANDTPPPLTERDALVVTDADVVDVFTEMLKLKDAGKNIDAVKAKAIELAEQRHTFIKCAGLSLKQTNGKWAVRRSGE